MKSKIPLSLKISLLVMVVSLIGILILSYISYNEANKIFTSYSTTLLKENVDKEIKRILFRVKDLEYDIKMISYNPLIKGFFRAYYDPYKYDEKTNRTYSQYKSQIENILSLMLKQNSEYFQMRLLDEKGNELVKLVKEKNKIKVDSLQNKANRNYFKDILHSKDDIYFSKINLNREFHTIEFPIKPTLRVGKVLKIGGGKKGIIIINVNIYKFLKVKKLKESHTQTFIANKDGDYIYNTLDPNKNFGFEFGKDFKIYYDFHFIKPLFENRKSLTLIKDDKIYVAKKLYLSPTDFLVILKMTSNKIFEEKSKEYFHKLILSIIIIVIFITILTSFLTSILVRPIKKLIAIANEIVKTKGEKYIKIDIKTNDEIEELAKTLDIMLKKLIKSKKEIEHFANNLEKEVDKKTKELQKINKNLQKMVEEQVSEIRKKEQALIQQSKMAAMGEMIGAIAHQWRQPLNSLALNIQMLEHMDNLDEKTLKEFIDKNMQTIKFMSDTIDDFRNFFRKDKEKVVFDVKEVIEKTINLQRAQLQNRGIELKTDLESVKVKGFKNEFMQVILNLISNARDALEGKEKKEIYISSKKVGDDVIVTIKDSGGGIDEKIMDRIFEPYFTTKEEGTGTGLGLYMSKEIIERMGGTIDVKNSEDGAEFIIKLKVYNETE